MNPNVKLERRVDEILHLIDTTLVEYEWHTSIQSEHSALPSPSVLEGLRVTRALQGQHASVND